MHDWWIDWNCGLKDRKPIFWKIISMFGNKNISTLPHPLHLAAPLNSNGGEFFYNGSGSTYLTALYLYTYSSPIFTIACSVIRTWRVEMMHHENSAKHLQKLPPFEKLASRLTWAVSSMGCLPAQVDEEQWFCNNDCCTNMGLRSKRHCI